MTRTTTVGDDLSKTGEIFSAHVAKVLDAEFERRKTLEARGGTIITTSAAMLALIVAVSALLLGKDKVVLASAASPILVVASLVTFVIANVLAIFVQNYSLAYTVTANETLDAMTGSRWGTDEDNARRVCTRRQVNTIKSLRHGNTWKARLAYVGLFVEVVAIGLLASAAVVELISHIGKQP
jgi:hypothetical protein